MGTSAANALTARWAAALDDGQTVFSGAGVYVLLALLAPFASGAARDELLAVAPTPLTLPYSPTTRLATGVWTRAEVPLSDAFADAVPARLRGVLSGDPAVDQPLLNAWVAEQTGGQIGRMPVRFDPSTLMVLASALSVRTNWVRRFTDGVEAPADGPWAGRRLAGLSQRGRDLTPLRVAGGVTLVTVEGADDVDVVLALGAPGLAAAGVLPVAIAGGAPQPIEEGPGVSVREVEAADDEPELVVRTVRFSVSGAHDLLGRAPVFGLGAASDLREGHFPGVSPVPLGVGQARQDAVAEFTAEGFRAAAITAFAMYPASAMMPLHRFRKRIFDVTFDRPFGFVAVHRPTGLVLVAGWVSDPEPYRD